MKYKFNFNPKDVFRIYQNKKLNKIKIDFIDGGSLETFYEPNDFDNYKKQLEEHCMTKRIGVTIYNEKN